MLSINQCFYANTLVNVSLAPHRRSLMFWSDTVMRTIKCANLNGENEITLVNSSIRAVGKLGAGTILLYSNKLIAFFCLR